jgi:hypothetical protein
MMVREVEVEEVNMEMGRMRLGLEARITAR